MIINFKEINSPNSFEKFCAHLLSELGYKILRGPGEGCDGGKDLIVEYNFIGPKSNKVVKYIVSCKLKLSKTISVSDETNIADRVLEHGCSGFIGFYSNHVSQKLVERISGIQDTNKIDTIIWNGDDIREHIISLPEATRFIKQWFPVGYISYIKSTVESNVYKNRPVMRCDVCEHDLLDDFKGVVSYRENTSKARTPTNDLIRDDKFRPFVDEIGYFCEEHAPTLEKWFNHKLEDLIDPSTYIRKISDDIKHIYVWPPYFGSDAVFRKWNHLIHILYYFVARNKFYSKHDETNYKNFPRPPEITWGDHQS